MKILLEKDFSFQKYDAEEYGKCFQAIDSLKHNRKLGKKFAEVMLRETLDTDDLLFMEGYIHSYGIKAEYREEVAEKAIEQGSSRIFKALLKYGFHTTKELRKKMRGSSSKFIRDYADKDFRRAWKSQKPELSSEAVLKKLETKILSAYEKVGDLTLEAIFLAKYAEIVRGENWLLVLWLLEMQRSAVFEVYHELFAEEFGPVLSSETDNIYEIQFQCGKIVNSLAMDKEVLVRKLQRKIESIYPDAKGFFKLHTLFVIANFNDVSDQLWENVRSLDFLKEYKGHPLTEFFLKVCRL